MADVSSITLPGGGSYDLKDKTAISGITLNLDNSVTLTKRGGTTQTVKQGVSKTYTGLLGSSSNNAAGDSWYFISVRPDDLHAQWRFRYRLTCTIPGHTEFHESSEVEYFGYNVEAAPAYRIYNTILSTSYRPYFYHNFYRLKTAGFNAGLGCAVGVGLRGSHQRTTSGYERTIEVEILECYRCEATLLDEAVKWAYWPSGTSTNYAGLSEYNGTLNGQITTNISNTYDRTVVPTFNPLVGSNGAQEYGLVMQKADGTYETLVTTGGTGTDKTKNPSGFNPRKIFYNGNSADKAPGARFGSSYLYYSCPLDFRYASNCGTTLTAHEPLYLVGTIGSDGLFYLDDIWWTQDLPTTENNKVYIYLGETYSNYQLTLAYTHPIYEYKNGRVREWSDSVIDQSNVTNRPVIETQVEASATYATGDQLVTISHTKTGYTCYLIGCPQFGLTENFFVYVKNFGANQAELYIVNRGASITGSIGSSIWLCMPND